MLVQETFLFSLIITMLTINSNYFLQGSHMLEKVIMEGDFEEGTFWGWLSGLLTGALVGDNY